MGEPSARSTTAATPRSKSKPAHTHTHTLKLDYYVGLKSPTVTFTVGDNDTVHFVCHARSAATGLPWLIGSLLFQHDAWILLERT
jgi:hypothetical protein